jgi:hypothetical protein
MLAKKLMIPFFALAVGLAACGDDKVPATGGSGGAVGAGGAGGAGSGGANAPGAGGMIVTGGSSGAGGGSGGVIGNDGSTSGGNTGTSDGGVDRANTSETGPDVAVEVRPETAAETAPDSGGADAGTAAFCPKTFPASSLPGISPADFCALYGQICKFPGGGILHASMADCVAKYGALSDSVKACRAAHLCYGTRETPGTHCVHASGFNWPGCS